MRIKRCLDDEAQAKREAIKKQKEDDERVGEPGPSTPRTSTMLPSLSTPSSSAWAPAVGESSLGPQSSPTKRKGGQDGAQDIDDLLREVEVEEDKNKKMDSVDMLEEVFGSAEAAGTALEIGAVDLVEMFSPPGMTKELERFGLRDGIAIDLDEMKPDGTERWDLDREQDFQQVLDLIAMEQPLLLTSSPACTTFCPLRRISNPRRDPKVVAEEEELGKERLRKAMIACETQADLGGFFYMSTHGGHRVGRKRRLWP